MVPDELKLRTKKFALRVIKLYRSLAKEKHAEVLGYQMLRSGTSVGANYRAACRARSQVNTAKLKQINPQSKIRYRRSPMDNSQFS